MSPSLLMLQFLLLTVACEGCNIVSRGLSDKEQATILRRHNDLRARVANGQQAGLPTAANMQEMVWDDDVASAAQDWADRCLFEHGQVNTGGEYMGQNLAWTGGGKMVVKQQIQAFYDEVEIFNPHEINHFSRADGVGHFTQVIWAESYKIGCGKTVYNNNGMHEEILVCNYTPGGNFVGSTIYKAGIPCSSCPKGCSKTYEGLCEPGGFESIV